MADIPSGSLSGQRFGNYIAIDVIGQGGMGTVYLAEHPDIGRKVAIKVIAQTDSEEIVDRFLVEAKAISRIGHPGIVDIFDFGRTESGRFYYVMEYLEGKELSVVMTEKRRMKAKEIFPYLKQICEAVQAAHDAGIVHRDLKPANIFIQKRRGDMQVKILDFGVAKLLDKPAEEASKTLPGMLIGTPMFSAPEQAAAELSKICPQTDLYSLGVIIFWMLTGRPPFMADNNAVLMTMHLSDPPPSIRKRSPSVSRRIEKLVHQCLAKAPEDRPASASLLAEEFEMAVKAETSEDSVDEIPEVDADNEEEYIEPIKARESATVHRPGATSQPAIRKASSFAVVIPESPIEERSSITHMQVPPPVTAEDFDTEVHDEFPFEDEKTIEKKRD